MEQQSTFTGPALNPQYIKADLSSKTITKKQKKSKYRWAILSAILASIIVVLVIFFFIAQVGEPDFNPTPVTASELKTVTQIHASEFAQVGTGGVINPLLSTKIKDSTPPLAVGPHSKPLIFSSEAEYCPYCAAQRWAMVIALSQFGTFHKIDRIVSSENAIATFTFQQSEYSSAYVDLVAVERSQDSSKPGVHISPQLQHILSVYNAPPYVPAAYQGQVPFIDIGNRYVMSGAAYDVHIIIDRSWQEIAAELANPGSPITQGIIGTANYTIAAICTVTQEQPATVCQRPIIRHIQQSLK